MAKKDGELNESQKKFCLEYIFDFNGTRAYQTAYPDAAYDSARVCASELLTKLNIKAYIDHLQADLSRTAGISRLKVLREHEKIAFSSIAHLHNSWIERKEFDNLTEEQKSCIEEISTQIKTSRNTDGTLEENEYVKIKLYSKQKSLDSINRMLGFDAPDRIQVEETVKTYNVVAASQRNRGK